MWMGGVGLGSGEALGGGADEGRGCWVAGGREGRGPGGRGLPEKPHAALGLSGRDPCGGGGLGGGDLMGDLGRVCRGQVRLWGEMGPGLGDPQGGQGSSSGVDGASSLLPRDPCPGLGLPVGGGPHGLDCTAPWGLGC